MERLGNGWFDKEPSDIAEPGLFMAEVDTNIALGRHIVRFELPIEGVPKSGGWSAFIAGSWWAVPVGCLTDLRDVDGRKLTVFLPAAAR